VRAFSPRGRSRAQRTPRHSGSSGSVRGGASGRWRRRTGGRRRRGRGYRRWRGGRRGGGIAEVPSGEFGARGIGGALGGLASDEPRGQAGRSCHRLESARRSKRLQRLLVGSSIGEDRRGKRAPHRVRPLRVANNGQFRHVLRRRASTSPPDRPAFVSSNMHEIASLLFMLATAVLGPTFFTGVEIAVSTASRVGGPRCRRAPRRHSNVASPEFRVDGSTARPRREPGWAGGEPGK